MASLRDCARQVIETAREGIGFIVLWKVGRSWNVADFWPEDFDCDNSTIRFDSDDMPEIRAIMEADPHAVLLNSYYHNLGGMDDLTVDVLTRALRWQYTEGYFYMADWTIEAEETSPDTEAAAADQSRDTNATDTQAANKGRETAFTRPMEPAAARPPPPQTEKKPPCATAWTA